MTIRKASTLVCFLLVACWHAPPVYHSPAVYQAPEPTLAPLPKDFALDYEVVVDNNTATSPLTCQVFVGRASQDEMGARLYWFYAGYVTADFEFSSHIQIEIPNPWGMMDSYIDNEPGTHWGTVKMVRPPIAGEKPPPPPAGQDGMFLYCKYAATQGFATPVIWGDDLGQSGMYFTIIDYGLIDHEPVIE